MISYPSIRVSLCLILTIVLLNRGCFCTRCLHEVSHQVSDPVLEGLLHSFPTEHFADQVHDSLQHAALEQGDGSAEQHVEGIAKAMAPMVLHFGCHHISVRSR